MGRIDGTCYSIIEFGWNSLLHLGALEQIPQVLEWIHRWAGGLNLEVLSPEGWYTNVHKQGKFLCPPSGCGVVEQLCEAVHKGP
jgi:hypothetical protein